MRAIEKLFKLSHILYKYKVPCLPFIIKWIIRILFSADIHYKLKTGDNVHFAHSGLGIVIHRNVVIGNNVIIAHHVTIGGNMGEPKLPVIGNNVFIGPGAKILGDLTIGNNVLIGANSVVVNSIPDNSIVVGIPGKKIRNFTDRDFHILFNKNLS